MKRLFCLFLVCLGFASCESDNIDQHLSNRIASIEINTEANAGLYGTTVTGTTYIFEYDEIGRLKKINDKEFYYGANGLVAFSKIERKIKDGSRDEEYIEHLSYHWDEQKRLKNIYIDLLQQKYIHSYSAGYDAQSMEKDNTLESVLLATFFYESTNRKPSSIRYREMYKDPSSLLVSLGEEEEAHYLYDGGNVISARLAGYLRNYLPGTDPLINLRPYSLEASHTYLEKPHYLLEIYTQLGFHPFNIGEVISANSIERSQTTIKVEEGNDLDWTPPEGGNINWTDIGTDTGNLSFGFDGKTTYRYRFNKLDLPTEIIEEREGGMQRTRITYE